jgi:hypothetical protein
MSTVFANFFVFIPDFFFQTVFGRKKAFPSPAALLYVRKNRPAGFRPRSGFV